MSSGELKSLPLRTESEFLIQNRDSVRTEPHKMKSELQAVKPQLLNPEHRQYNELLQRFNALFDWIEVHLGFQIPPEEKTALLHKVYLVNPEKFSQFAQKNSDQRTNLHLDSSTIRLALHVSKQEID